MIIKLNVDVFDATTGKSYSKGEVTEMDKETAEALIVSGLAEAVIRTADQEKKKIHRKILKR